MTLRYLGYPYLAPESGAEDGSGSGGEEKKEFDVNAFAESTTTTIAKLQKDLKGVAAATSDIKALKDSIAALQTSLQSLTNPKAKQEDKAGTTDDEEGENENTEKPARGKRAQKKVVEETPNPENEQITSLQRELKKVQESLKREQEARTAAELRQRNAERDRLLIAAATEADAINPQDAARFLGLEVSWDDDSEEWVFRRGDDTFTIAEGAKKLLPKYMLKPKTQGGSGSSGSRGSSATSVDALKTQAVDLGVAAKKDGGRSIGRYNAALRAYAEAGGDVADVKTAVASAA